MDSSPGFGSNPSDVGALFGLAFASAPGMNPLAMPLRVKSLAHYAKGTLSPLAGLQLLCTQYISGTISSPFRGAFHLSLTVLIRY